MSQRSYRTLAAPLLLLALLFSPLTPVLSADTASRAVTLLDFEHHPGSILTPSGATWSRGDGLHMEFTPAPGARGRSNALQVRAVGEKGWAYGALMLDCADLSGAESVSFWARADKPTAVGIHLSTCGDPWKAQEWWGQTLTLGPQWQQFSYQIATLPQTAPQGAHTALDPSQIVCLAIGGLRPGEAIYLDDLTAILPAERSLRKEFTELHDDLTGWLSILDARGTPLGKGSERLAALNATFAQAPAAGSLVQLHSLEQDVLLGRTLLRLQRQAEALAEGALTVRQTRGMKLPAALAASLAACRRNLDRARRCYAEGNPTTARPLVTSLEARLNQCYDALLPLRRRADQAGAPRITIHERAFHLPSGRRVTFWGWGTLTMLNGKPIPEEHLRAMAEMGANVVRMVVPWEALEPERGKLISLDGVQETLRRADRYGIYCTFDLHFMAPNWFLTGPAEAPNRWEMQALTNPFLDRGIAVADVHRRIATELKNEPNLIGYEIPFNEAFLDSGSEDVSRSKILPYPLLMRDWNDWLKQRYHTRSALDAAWRATPYATTENGLDAAENWETATILPPGIRGVPADQDTRVGDYLRWAASLLTRVNARVGEAIKTVSPRSLLLQQPLAETHQWSREALPLDLQALMQSHPACVDVVATHYSQGGRQDWLANGVGAPHLDSETACNGRPADFIRHHAHNGGACLWCFGERGFGAVRPDGWWERSHDNNGRLIHSWFDWIAQVADFQRDAWNTRHPQVLLVANTRRFALGNPDYFGAARLLEQLGVEFDVIASQALLEHPEALRRYHAVVAGTSYADLDTLKLLADSHLPVLYVGPLSADEQARFAAQPVARFFKDRRLFLKSLPAPKAATDSAPTGLDLAGNWRFHTDPNDTGVKDGWQQPSLDESAWDEQPVPTYWENINVLGKARDYDGVAWYRKRFTIPAEWSGSTLALEIGAVDDFDEAYLNGVKIGATGAETPAYWMARRLYRLPVEAIRFGQENVLAIRVIDNGGNGGIWKGPVRLTRTAQIPYQITADLGLLHRGEQGAASGVDGLPQSLVSGQILARFVGEGAPVAALRQGTVWLWLADDTLAAESPVHRKLLAAFLQANSVGCRTTPPAWAEKAQVWHYDGYYTVSQTADGKLDLPLATHCALRPLYGATAQQIRADGTSLLPLEGKYGQGAAVLRETPLQVLPRSGNINLTAVRDYDFRTQGRVVTLETEGSAALLTWRGPAATLNVDGKRCVWKQKGAQREALLPAGKHRIRIETGERISDLKSGNKSRSENLYRS